MVAYQVNGKAGDRKKRKCAGSGATLPRCVSSVARFWACLGLWVVGLRICGYVGCFPRLFRCSCGCLPLLSVVAPGGSVAPFFLRFPRCPRLLLLVAASPLLPVVPLLRGLWVCGLLHPYVPLILWVLRCFRLWLRAVPLLRCPCGFSVARGCGSRLFRCYRALLPVVPLLLWVLRRSRLLLLVVAPPLLLWVVAPLIPVVVPGCILLCSQTNNKKKQKKKRRAKKTGKKGYGLKFDF